MEPDSGPESQVSLSCDILLFAWSAEQAPESPSIARLPPILLFSCCSS